LKGSFATYGLFEIFVPLDEQKFFKPIKKFDLEFQGQDQFCGCNFFQIFTDLDLENHLSKP